MSGDVQARNSGKLRHRNKKRSSAQDMGDVQVNGSDVNDVPKQQHQVKKSKKPKSSGSSSGPKGKHQQFYYEELSDGEDEVYDYDIAAPRLRLHQNKSTCLGVCVKSLVLVFLAASIGMGGLYLHDPKEFWTTVDQAEAYMKPLGANALWPDFQGIQNLNLEHFNSVLNIPYDKHWENYVVNPINEHIITRVLDLIAQAKALVATNNDEMPSEEKGEENIIIEPLEPSFNVPEVPEPVELPKAGKVEPIVEKTNDPEPAELPKVGKVEPIIEKTENAEPAEPPKAEKIESVVEKTDESPKVSDDPIIDEIISEIPIAKEPPIVQKTAYTVGEEPPK